MNNTLYLERIQKPKKKRKTNFNFFDLLNHLFLIILAFICIYPVVHQLLLSISSKQDYLHSVIITIPRNPSLESYKYIFGQGRVLRALGVSLFVTIVGTIYSMLLTCLGAYVFTRKNVPG